MMDKRRAVINDLETLTAFYHAVVLQQQEDEYGPRWTWGIYPSMQDISEHLEKGDIHVGLSDGMIAAAGILTYGEDEIYREVDWKIKTDDSQIAVLHLFAVGKQYRRSGVAGEMLEYFLQQASGRAEVMHLDVMAGNIPAEKLYRRVGFEYAGRREIFYEDTGKTEADMFEFDLRKLQ